MKNDKEVLAVDFDGVIHDHLRPVPGRRMGAPIAGAKEALESLRGMYRIVVFSVWGKSKAVTDWLDFYEIPYDEATNVKPKAAYYIDDRGVAFTDWEEVLAHILD